MWRRVFFVMLMLLIVIVCFGLLVASCQAQEYRGHGYVFAAPGTQTVGSEYTFHFGGGGEAFIKRGFAVGGELGYLGLTRSYNNGFGVLSANAAYHFVPSQSERKLIPFVTGGYSLGFRDGSMNLVNFGGGVTWWVARRHGIRFELRDHLDPRYDHHYFGARVGWTFR